MNAFIQSVKNEQSDISVPYGDDVSNSEIWPRSWNFTKVKNFSNEKKNSQKLKIYPKNENVNSIKKFRPILDVGFWKRKTIAVWFEKSQKIAQLKWWLNVANEIFDSWLKRFIRLVDMLSWTGLSKPIGAKWSQWRTILSSCVYFSNSTVSDTLSTLLKRHKVNLKKSKKKMKISKLPQNTASNKMGQIQGRFKLHNIQYQFSRFLLAWLHFHQSEASDRFIILYLYPHGCPTRIKGRATNLGAGQDGRQFFGVY